MYIDIIVGILLAFGFYVGYSRGIIKTVFAVISLIVAIIAAMKLSPLMITLLDRMVSWDPRLIIITAFVLTFMIVVAAIRFIGISLEKMLSTLKINVINKLAGGVVMSLIALVIFSWFVWLLDEVELLSQRTKQQSITYEYIEPIPESVSALGKQVKPFFQSFWDKTSEAMDKVREEGEERIQ